MALSDRLTKIGLFGGMRKFSPIGDKPPVITIGNLFNDKVKNLTDYGKVKNLTDYAQIKRVG